jgi:diguanylate cyclase (GGDEF)-like protein/PAS domain S-box-containing protein
MSGKDEASDILKNKLAEARRQVAELKNAIKGYEKQEGTVLGRENLYRSLVESTDDSIYLVDKNCQYIFMNKKHLLRLGLLSEHFMQRPYSDFHSPRESKLFKEKVGNIFDTGVSAQYEYKSERDCKYFLQTFSPVKDTDGNIIAVNVISKNITKLKEMEEKLRTLSFTDELTGLYNRRGFFALAEQQIKLANRDKKGRFLISADLDYLKTINDNLGHKAGDLALIETAITLKKSFRESDIIARIGGDEFVVMVTETSVTSIEELISRLKSNLDTRNTDAKKDFELSLSIGTVQYSPAQPCSVDALLSSADKLMYEEKKQKQTDSI